MNHYTSAIFFICALLLGFGWADLSVAAQAKPEKPTVKIGYASQSGAFAQLWIAAQRGFFAAEGFVVDHAARSVEPLNGVSKGGEHPLWSRAGSIPRPRSGFVY